MMRLLLITNLYPPQELGGFGRCMADFAWGLMARGHQIQVLCNNAEYLGDGGVGPSGEAVNRSLQLKGSFSAGVRLLKNPAAKSQIDQINIRLIEKTLSTHQWDGVLIGNLDLLGVEILMPLIASNLRLLHHIGFVTPPYAPEDMPMSSQYRVITASAAVRDGLVQAGMPISAAPVVYPGARVDLFGAQITKKELPHSPDGTKARPLKVCFAGLLMVSKGPHTLLEALLILENRNVAVEMMIAGGSFQAKYVSRLHEFCKIHNLQNHIYFLPQLCRQKLAKFFRSNHVCVFSSIYPEAFGIVAAEAMASGLALVSTGVGGARELFEEGISGLSYPAGYAAALADQLEKLAKNPSLLKTLQQEGEKRIRSKFSVESSAKQIEELFK
jgi:glycosyltransferase involved in cell wall biosynthesis